MRIIGREMKIFLLLFLFLAFFIHFDAWITDPYTQWEALKYSSLGVWHPLVLTAGIYLLITLIRIFVQMIKGMRKKRI